MNLLVIFKALVIRYLFVYKDMETIFSLHDFFFTKPNTYTCMLSLIEYA